MYRTAAVLLAIGLAVAGCTGNDDGSISCKDFNELSNDAQGAVIARMLKERNGLNSSTGDVERRAATTARLCGSAANLDKTVDTVNS